MSDSVSISNSIEFDGNASIFLPAGVFLELPIDIKETFDLTFFSAAFSGSDLQHIDFSFDCQVNDTETPCNAGAIDPATGWRKYSVTISEPGTNIVKLKVVPGVSSNLDSGDLAYYLAQFEVAGQPIDLQAVVDLQPMHLQKRGLEDQSLDNIENFTSFEQTGPNYFLSYIPWIYSRTFVLGAPAQQATTALSGVYSCYLYEDIVSTTSLETQNLDVPAGADQVIVGGWFNPNYTGAIIDYHVLLDGNEVRSGSWRFENDELGQWVLHQTTVPIPAGTNVVYAWIRLRSKGMTSGNSVYLDDYFVDFVESVPQRQTNVIVGDMGGTLYALGAETGTQIATFQTAYGYLTSAPKIVNGIAYLGDGHTDANLYALNARDLTKIWYNTVPGSIDATPAVVGDAVYTTSSSGYLYAVNKSNGSQLWSLDVLGLSSGTLSTIYCNIVIDGVAYLGSDSGIFAVDLSSQRVKWSSSSYVASNPVLVAHGKVFFGTRTGQVVALDADTGARVWSYTANGPVRSIPIWVGGLIVFGDDVGNLYGLDYQNGASVWSENLGQYQIQSLTQSGNTLFVVGNAISAKLFSISYTSSNGTISTRSKWSFDFTNGSSAPPTVQDDYVYVTGAGEKIHSVNIVTGQEQWSFQPSQFALASPAYFAPDPLTDTSRRFDQYCYLTTHNAYANNQAGWLYAQQVNSIIGQLNDGVRGLMLDVHRNPDNANEVVYCHESCSVTNYIQPFTPYENFTDSLTAIYRWMQNNPNEVITIILEQRVGNATILQNSYNASGINDITFYADRTNQGVNSSWNVGTQGWPTLAWMIANNKRVVIFSDWNTSSNPPPPSKNDGFPFVWTYTVENRYGNDSVGGGCVARHGSLPLTTPTSQVPLFIMNYFSTISVNLPIDDYVSGYDYNNAFGNVMSKVNVCQGLNNRLPNFIAVDYYQYGFDGGPREVTAAVNRLWAQQS